MVDSLDPSRRSWNMGRIKGKNTRPEIAVRSLLHSMGFRFRLHRRDLPGTPDIVLPKYRTAIFINGCFWHRHPGCKYAYTPKSRTEFWEKKFKGTTQRDASNRKLLMDLGWKVETIWECELRNIEQLREKIEKIRG